MKKKPTSEYYTAARFVAPDQQIAQQLEMYASISQGPYTASPLSVHLLLAQKLPSPQGRSLHQVLAFTLSKVDGCNFDDLVMPVHAQLWQHISLRFTQMPGAGQAALTMMMQFQMELSFILAELSAPPSEQRIKKAAALVEHRLDYHRQHNYEYLHYKGSVEQIAIDVLGSIPIEEELRTDKLKQSMLEQPLHPEGMSVFLTDLKR